MKSLINRAVLAAFCMVFICSCELFNGAADPGYLDKLHEEIAWANAARLTVTVGFPAEWGSSSQRGTGRCGDTRLGYPFKVEFGAMPGYGFEEWLAVYTDDYDELNKSLSAGDIIESGITRNEIDVFFETIPTAFGSHTTTVVIKTEIPITLVPWCGDRPVITYSNPPLVGGGFYYTRSQQIVMKFSMGLIYLDEKNQPINFFGENLIQISGQGIDGTQWNRDESIKGTFYENYFENPVYDPLTQTITIIPKKDNEPPENYNITITIGTGLIGANGNGFSSPISFSYRTSKELVTMAYKANNIWASHDPLNDRRVESFFFQTAPSDRDRRLRRKPDNSYEVSLFFNVSRSMGEIENSEPNALSIVQVHYAELNSDIRSENNIKTVHYNIGNVLEPGTFITMNRNENSAGGVYRQMNNISNPLDVHYYETVFSFPANTPSGIYRLVLLPYQAGDPEMYKDEWTTAVSEGRFVSIVIDNDAPNTNGMLFFSGHAMILENGTYCYSTDMRFLTITPNFLSVSDNETKGGILSSQATPNIPWTMDENKNLFWKWNITSSDGHNIPGSDWLPVGTTPPPFDLLEYITETDIYGDLGNMESATVFDINVIFKDSIGNENEDWTKMGDIIFTTPPPALPPTNWRAVYNEENGEILISWTTPISMRSVRIDGNLPHTITPINGTGENFRRITNIPKVTTTGDIVEYDITLTAFIGDGGNGEASPPVRFKIFNVVGGMTVDSNNPAFAVNSETITSMRNDTTTGALGPNNANKQWVLTEDTINLINWTPIGTVATNDQFMGKFYGNGQTITISSFNSTTQTYFGLFGSVSNAIIRDLNVEYSTAITITGTGERYVGGIAAFSSGTQTQISNSTVSSSTESSTANLQINIPAGTPVHLGSIVGRRLNNPQINNCSGVDLNITASAANNRSLNHWLIDDVINNSINSTQYTLLSSSSSQPSQKVSAVMNIFNITDFTDDATAADTPGTLRYALTHQAFGDIIRFNVPAGSIGTSAATITLAVRLPYIENSMTIEGNGVTITRASTGETPSNATQLMLINGTLANVTISRVHFKNGRASHYGAAIRNRGILTLDSCIFSGNEVSGGSTLAREGGAIYNSNSGAMIVRGCTFYNNKVTNTISSADGHGAAIYNDTGSLTLTGNLFYGNHAKSGSHVVYRNGGTVISDGFNVYDNSLFVSNPQGFTAHGTDRSLLSNPLIATDESDTATYLRPLGITGGAMNAVTSSRPIGYPTVDFYGNSIPAGTAHAGAIQGLARDVYIVNRSDDPGSGYETASHSTQGALRHAIITAPSETIIYIDRALVGDTITLTRELRFHNRNVNLIIEGNGVIITKRETSNNRLLWKGNAGNLTIRNVHFTGGYRSSSSDGGAAIKQDGGTSLILESCIFSNNNNVNTNASGGAIHNSSNATLIIRGCTFYNNTGTRGSAIFSDSTRTVTLSGNLFYGNIGSNIVNNHNVSSNYNIFDRDFGTANDQSGIPRGTGDATLATVLGGTNTNTTWPFDGSAETGTQFIPRSLGTLRTFIPAGIWANDNMPAVDFYGKPRVWPGPPGAVQH